MRKSKVDYFMDVKPLISKDKCGDFCIIEKFNNELFIAIVDVAGHGESAYSVAVSIKKFLKKNYKNNLSLIMNGVHEELKGTVGAVAGLFLLDLDTGIVKYIVVGNITARIFGTKTMRIISKQGIIGYVLAIVKEEIVQLHNNDVLLLYTDGIREHFELEDYQEILKDDAKTIVINVMDKFNKKHDDSACIALKFKVTNN